MMHAKHQPFPLLLTAIALFVAIRFGLSQIPEHYADGAQIPQWLIYISSLLNALAVLLPSGVAGYLTTRAPALLGFLVAFLGAVIAGMTFDMHWEFMKDAELGARVGQVVYVITLSIGTGLIGLSAGAAGKYFADSARPSNLLERKSTTWVK